MAGAETEERVPNSASTVLTRLVQVLDVHPLSLDNLEEVEVQGEARDSDGQKDEAGCCVDQRPQGDGGNHKDEHGADQSNGVDDEPREAEGVLPLGKSDKEENADGHLSQHADEGNLVIGVNVTGDGEGNTVLLGRNVHDRLRSVESNDQTDCVDDRAHDAHGSDDQGAGAHLAAAAGLFQSAGEHLGSLLGR